eukprot:NODE_5904_length_544_cov_59.137374_g5157_i0.p1 GENE.NODE_5904_length_544_cov_59.137374_g5157_i0~~NODE_5904_length_544_cov_59.137374_g5157_i0.p1  ORF type:complete len:137 (+),score=21.25 NODE_5904_length_544_cov_59.137374_g5157_i0:1-411(+)
MQDFGGLFRQGERDAADLRQQREQFETRRAMHEAKELGLGFAMRSRPELVRELWALHGALGRAKQLAQKALRAARTTEPGAEALEGLTLATEALQGASRQCTHIISEFLTDVEKLHLGASVLTSPSTHASPERTGR